METNVSFAWTIVMVWIALKFALHYASLIIVTPAHTAQVCALTVLVFMAAIIVKLVLPAAGVKIAKVFAIQNARLQEGFAMKALMEQDGAFAGRHIREINVQLLPQVLQECLCL